MSPLGTLGFPAAALIGRAADSLLDRDTSPAVSPFGSTGRVEGRNLHALDAAGNRRFLSVSSVPLKSRTGDRLGNRGVWRDVTRQAARSR